jgi:DNA-binding GntR family transcriptional regulator
VARKKFHLAAVPKSGAAAVVESRNRITEAYQRLRELIVQGRLAPGARVVESEVAERLGISRTPVRSALQRLQQEGYIISADGGRHARLSIAPLTIPDARELFEIVGAVEGMAASRAAGIDATSRARLVTELIELNGALLRSSEAQKPDQRELYEVDTAFHRTYVEAAAGPRILSLHNAIKPQAERYIRLYVSALTNEIGSSVIEHNHIIDAIKSGDAKLSRSAVQTNWKHAGERLSEVIATMGEKGSW